MQTLKILKIIRTRLETYRPTPGMSLAEWIGEDLIDTLGELFERPPVRTSCTDDGDVMIYFRVPHVNSIDAKVLCAPVAQGRRGVPVDAEVIDLFLGIVDGWIIGLTLEEDTPAPPAKTADVKKKAQRFMREHIDACEGNEEKILDLAKIESREWAKMVSKHLDLDEDAEVSDGTIRKLPPWKALQAKKEEAKKASAVALRKLGMEHDRPQDDF